MTVEEMDLSPATLSPLNYIQIIYSRDPSWIYQKVKVSIINSPGFSGISPMSKILRLVKEPQSEKIDLCHEKYNN